MTAQWRGASVVAAAMKEYIAAWPAKSSYSGSVFGAGAFREPTAIIDALA